MEDEQITDAAHDQAGGSPGDPLAAEFLEIVPQVGAKEVVDDQSIIS
jgi:hypothetical protein